jgi:hypothetical protein
MCPPWIEGAHAGAPQEDAFLTSMSATWYQAVSMKRRKIDPVSLSGAPEPAFPAVEIRCLAQDNLLLSKKLLEKSFL